jgi:DNA-3-methyladenine glycosylase
MPQVSSVHSVHKVNDRGGFPVTTAKTATAEYPRVGRTFYERPVLEVARDCIGLLLVRRSEEGSTTGVVVEAEAYRGPADRAAHSFGGRRTPRTEVMFGRAGKAYVFFVYGMHWNFNVVCGAVNEPHVVLLRAVEPVSGVDLMRQRRGLAETRGATIRNLTNGPGKLCQAFAIGGSDYGVDLCESTHLYLTRPPSTAKRRVARSPRIGIDYAGAWAEKPWRFFDPSSAFLSRRPASGAP